MADRVTTWLRRKFNRPTGWWTGPSSGYLKHNCTPPGLPRGVPGGLIYRCECGSEWTWKPARGVYYR